MEEAEIEHMLVRQQSFELFCPDCEACVTREVILQKRKRKLEATHDHGERHPHLADDSGAEVVDQGVRYPFCKICDHSFIDDLYNSDQGDGSQQNFVGIAVNVIGEDFQCTKKRPGDSLAEEVDLNDLYIQSVISGQDEVDLLCPDCDACITSTLIVEWRRNSVVDGESGRGDPQGLGRTRSYKDLDCRAGGSSDDDGYQSDLGEGEDATNVNPPSKRRRRSVFIEITMGKLSHVFAEQSTHELTCPDCKAVITHRVILRKTLRRFSVKGQPPEDDNGRLDEARRRGGRPLDNNPWKTRCKLFYRRGRQPETWDEQEEQLESQVTRAGPSSTQRSLTDPLLPSEQTGRPSTFAERLKVVQGAMFDSFQTSYVYFVALLFLWAIWFLLHFV